MHQIKLFFLSVFKNKTKLKIDLNASGLPQKLILNKQN